MYASFNARAVGLALSAEATIDLAAAAGFGGGDLLIRDLADAGDDGCNRTHARDYAAFLGPLFPEPS